MLQKLPKKCIGYPGGWQQLVTFQPNLPPKTKKLNPRHY
ncbi:Protein CBG27509 [Caenorhabditis briggsae]|uniref:Protein CBG27509 n=1 Tax=Caenorhabditis briggsae TaxID=6238 RepID=B6IF24_CAEBR|nr:Protein CBG27509 [Caenorhabditis briggsae]CAR98504.1 Protein CBG27509 [Caenorhabditis briggsae]